MNRRNRTLVVGGVLFVVLFVLALTLPVPYVILSPGPTFNTLGRYQTDSGDQQIIVITGRPVNQTSGNLNMTTVNVSGGHVTAVQALIGWLQNDQTVVPRTAIYPPGQSVQQVNQQDTAQFAQSQEAATAAAFCELGYPRGFGVLRVDPKLNAYGKLEAGDQIVSVDGKPADSEAKLAAILLNDTPGQTVGITVKRSGVLRSEQVTLSKPAGNGKGGRLGVTVTTGCLAPFEVDLGLGDEIGGPSAGLMFALGIMDKVGPTNLTNGTFVAGTGEIQPDGKVLPIGGIQLKMIAARRAGATVFLAPDANCGDVRGAVPDGLNVIKVDTLHDAVQDLRAVEHGGSVPHC